MKSLSVSLSDAVVNRHAADLQVNELRDVKGPLVLRYKSSRHEATWYYVRYQNRQKRRVRIGYYPALKTKDVAAMLPELVKRQLSGEEPNADRFATVGDLLSWYQGRMHRDMSKSLLWRKSVLSAITAQLLPRLKDQPLTELSKSSIDNKLILPLMGESLKPSTIRKYWGVLKTAVAMAAKMDLLTRDYMAGWKFVDHVTKRIGYKESRLLLNNLPAVIEKLQTATGHAWGLVILMLMYGTRIGETRQLKWSHIDFISRIIVIPAELTKTNVTHVLPLTDLSVAVLDVIRQSQPAEQVYLFEMGDACIGSQCAQDHVRKISAGAWSAHDLRKLARTSWAQLGIDYWMAERLLNHKPRGLDAVYIKTDGLEQRLKSIQLYHDWLQNSGLNVGTMQALQNATKA